MLDDYYKSRFGYSPKGYFYPDPSSHNWCTHWEESSGKILRCNIPSEIFYNITMFEAKNAGDDRWLVDLLIGRDECLEVAMFPAWRNDHHQYGYADTRYVRSEIGLHLQRLQRMETLLEQARQARLKDYDKRTYWARWYWSRWGCSRPKRLPPPDAFKAQIEKMQSTLTCLNKLIGNSRKKGKKND